MQPGTSGYCVGHVVVTIVQKPSQFVPHAPPPPGPACRQCGVGAPAARPAWVARHASVSPDEAPAVPTGNFAHVLMHVFIESYCWFVPVQAVMIEVQYVVQS